MQSMFQGNTSNPIYQAEPGLVVFEHGGKKVLINPDLGGWAVVSDRELLELMHPSGFLSPVVGENAYICGLARENGHSVYNPSSQTDQLFFYEFSVSEECNLACVYCAAGTKPTVKIPNLNPLIGLKWVNRIIEHAANHAVRKIEVEFTGGEPLANTDFLTATIEYLLARAGENRIEPHISVVSNLTIVGPKQIEFLKKHPVSLNCSLDGDEDAQNGQRPFATGKGSFSAVVRNLQKLRDLGMPVKALQPTVTALTVERLAEIAQFLMDLGFTDMSLHFMGHAGAPEAAHDLAPDPQAYVDKLFEVFEAKFIPFYKKTGRMPYARMLALAFAYLLDPKRTYMCQRSPCGAGRTIMAVKPNGDVFGCATGPYVNELKYGNIWQDSFEDCQNSVNAMASSQRHFRNVPDCNACTYRGWCQAGCPKDAFATYGSILAPSGSCGTYKALWKRALESLIDERYPRDAVRALANAFIK